MKSRGKFAVTILLVFALLLTNLPGETLFVNATDGSGDTTAISGDTGTGSTEPTPPESTEAENTEPETEVQVVVGGIAAENKSYDGTTAATLDFSQVAFTTKTGESIVGADLSVTATGAFPDANVGENKTVTISDLALTSTDTETTYALAEENQQTEATASITQKPVGVTWGEVGFTYNGSTQVPTASISDTSPISGDDYGLSVSGAATDAGTYTATASISNSNYVLEGSTTQQFTILQKPLTAGMLTLSETSFLYSHNVLGPVVTVRDGATTLRENIDYTIDGTSTTRATEIGSYTIKVDGSGNYKGSLEASWSIAKDDVPVITVSSTSEHDGSVYYGPVTYRVEDDTLASVKIKNLATGEETVKTFTGATFTETVNEVGTYQVTATDSVDNVTTESFQIAQKEVMLQPHATSYIYNAGATYDVSNLFTASADAGVLSFEVVAGDADAGLGYLAEDGKSLVIQKVGEIKIRATAAATTYTKSASADATLSVSRAVGHAAISATDTTYGTLPTIEPSTDTNLGGTLTLTYQKTKDSDGKAVTADAATELPTEAGTYLVTATYGETALYQAASATAEFTIQKKTLVITAKNASKTYGTFDPALTYTVSGLERNDAESAVVSGTPVRSSGENVGSYAISRGSLTSNGNYRISFTGATFTITRAGLRIFAENKAKVYGEADPTLTYTVSGLKRNDSAASVLSGSLRRAQGEATGSYMISQGSLRDASGNYDVTFSPATLTIGKAVLTVTAEDQTKRYQDFDPELTYQVTGLQNGDTASTALSGELTRETGENTGSYAISQGTLTANKDYALSFTGASLTIEKTAHDALFVPTKIEISSEGVRNRTIDLSDYLEFEPTLIQGDAIGQIAPFVTVGQLNGTTLNFSVGASAGGESGDIRLVVGSRNFLDYEITIPLETRKKLTTVSLEGGDASSSVMDVAADGLSNYTEKQKAASVEVVMTVTPEAESSVMPAVVSAIGEKVNAAFSGVEACNIKKEYLEIQVEKTAGGESEEVSDLQRVIEVELRFNLNGKYQPVVVREHEGAVKSLTKLSSRPLKSYQDGTFFSNGSDTIYIYTRYFSTYTIAYADTLSYQVDFTNAGKSNAQTIVTANGRVPKPDDPKKSGYQFAGWYAADTAWNFDAPIATDLVLRAKWSSSGSGSAAQTAAGATAANGTANAGSVAPSTTAATESVNRFVSPIQTITETTVENKTNATGQSTATLEANTVSLSGRAPKTGDTMPPVWLFALFLAAGGLTTMFSAKELQKERSRAESKEKP